MTRGRDFKRVVRARMLKTGESYMAARARLTRHPPPASASTPGGSAMYPFERFTERAKKVLTMAQEEAERAGHTYIGTEHLLLGLLREKDGLAAKILGNFGIEIATVRTRIESVLGRNERILIQQIIPTSRVKKVIEISFEEAHRLGHQFVGTEHLLLGILIEGEGIAAHVLDEMGVTSSRTRAEVERMVSSGQIPPRPARFEGGGLSISPHLSRLLQRARTEAAEQGEGVTSLEHLLRVLVGDEGLGELSELLDSLRVPWQSPQELKELARRIQEVSNQKTDAARRRQHEAAAGLREEELRLISEYRVAETAWLDSFRPDQPPAQA